MFWIFKIFADWVWWLLLLAGIIGFCLSYLALLKPYQLLLKIVGLVTVAVALFVLGMLHADRTGQAAVPEHHERILRLEKVVGLLINNQQITSVTRDTKE
jgi:hypothetical protein